MSRKSIIIPVRGRTDVIEVFPHELPEDPTDVIEMLRAELAPLDIWCEFALAYHERGDDGKFREILLGVVDLFDMYEMQDFYRQEQMRFAEGRLRVLNLLAASATFAFNEPNHIDSRNVWKQKALEYIGRANKIDSNNADTNLCKSLFWIAEMHHDSNALRNARYYTDSASHANERSRAAIILDAVSSFHECNFLGALKLYLCALSVGVSCEGALRVGIALAAERLRSRNLATISAQRALTLQPMHVDALSFMACMRAIRRVSKQGVSEEVAAKMIRKAADLDPRNSQVLNQLAHVIFWDWERLPFGVNATNGFSEVSCRLNPSRFLSAGVDVRLEHAREDAFEARVLSVRYERTHRWVIELSTPFRSAVSPVESTSVVAMPLFWRDTPRVDELAARAYHGTTTPGTRAESYFILGRNRHVYRDAIGALPFYAHACELAPLHALAHFRVAQVQAAVGDLEAALQAVNSALELVPNVTEVLELRGVLELQKGLIPNAAHTLRQATELEKNAMSLVALGCAHELVAASGDRRALEVAAKAYESTAEALQCIGVWEPPELWNNIAVIRLELGDLQNAKLALACALTRFSAVQATTLISKVPNQTAIAIHTQGCITPRVQELLIDHFASGPFQARLTSILLNVVQMHILTGDSEEAKKLAYSLLVAERGHVRCHLLLARLAANVRDYVGAHKHVDIALSKIVSCLPSKTTLVDSKSRYSAQLLDAFSVAMSLLLEFGDNQLARKSINMLNVPADMRSCPLVLRAVCHVLDQDTQVENKELVSLKKSNDSARLAVQAAHSCVTGAHMLGVSLLLLDRHDCAIAIFQRVRESMQHTPSSGHEKNRIRGVPTATSRGLICWSGVAASGVLLDVDVNIAHGLSLVERWNQAADVYAACLKKTGSRDLVGSFASSPPFAQTRRIELHRCMARALFEAGDIASGMSAMSAALHSCPSSMDLWCDASALIHEASGIHLLYTTRRFARRLAEWICNGSHVTFTPALIERASNLIQPSQQASFVKNMVDDETSQSVSSQLRGLQRARLERVVADRRDRDAAEKASAHASAQLRAAKARERQSYWSSLITTKCDVDSPDIGYAADP